MFEPAFRKRVQPLVPKFVMRWMDPFHTALYQRLEETARSLPANAVVLDAGAGECPHSTLFAHTRYVKLDRGIGDHTWDYSRIDVQGDVCELPFRDGVFDAVVNIQVLEHIKEPGVCVAEMARVLKPGGQLILTTVQDWEIHQHPNDFFRYTRYGLEYLFEKAGLKSRVEALGGLFWNISFRLMAPLGFLQKGWRWILFVLLAPVFALVVPAICYLLDPLDRRRDYTLGYFCWCRKPQPQEIRIG
jgi:SAM-dependent methyltransferase